MGRKLTDEEKAARAAERARLAAERKAERERLKAQREQQKIAGKIAAHELKVEEAEGGRVPLPALVYRDGTVRPCTIPVAAQEAVIPFLDGLCLDVETSGYPLGHALYELRTIQLGGEHAAVVLDAGDERQLKFASRALALASRLHAHSAIADIVPVVHAGLIAWDDAWGKMRDSVLLAKLADPKSTGSEADGLKDLARDVLGKGAVSPAAEKAKNELFRAMGCKVKADPVTPPEQNGWHQVARNAVTMIRYAGSDVLDLGAVIPCLHRPVNIGAREWEGLLEREAAFQAACAIVAWKGFALDKAHIKNMITAHEYFRAVSLHQVQSLSGGLIANPSSPDTGAKLLQLFPGLPLERSEKTGEPSAARASIERPAAEGNELCKAILDYRHHVTILGLLLRPLENLCDYGDSRMRPTVYTINADTGRTSCVRVNGQQFSRRGQVRKCVVADPGFLGIACDFEGCEIRVASALSGDVALYEAELSGKCHACGGNPCACGREHKGLHWLAAHMVWGDGATKENRYVAKRIIFSKLFGGSPAAGARQTGITEDLSGQVHRAFEVIAPGYAQWDQFLRQCYYQGTRVWKDPQTWELKMEKLGGSRRAIWTAYSGRNIYINAPHAFGNYAIQGTARELLVDGILRWRQTRWGGYPVLPVHDEVLCWVPADEAREASKELQACMATRLYHAEIGADPDEPFAFWPDSS